MIILFFIYKPLYLFVHSLIYSTRITTYPQLEPSKEIFLKDYHGSVVKLFSLLRALKFLF